MYIVYPEFQSDEQDTLLSLSLSTPPVSAIRWV